MNNTTIEIGHKAKPFAKGLFLSAVQDIAKTLGDPSTHSRDSKNTYELTQDDIAKIREFVQSHYESDIHTLLSYGGRQAPNSWIQFSTLKLGSCQVLPESYYAEIKKLHGYYEAFGLEAMNEFKQWMQSRCSDFPYDRTVQQIGLETAKIAGITSMYSTTRLLKECKNPPRDTHTVSLVPYYTAIVELLKTSHHNSKPFAYIIANLYDAIIDSKYDGITMLGIIQTFFKQHKSQGTKKLQEFLEAFYDQTNSGLMDLLKDFAVVKTDKDQYGIAHQNQSFIENLIAVDNFQKLHTLYQRSKENKKLNDWKNILLQKEGYGQGIAYLNSVPLEILQQQLENGDLKKHYIAFQNI